MAVGAHRWRLVTAADLVGLGDDEQHRAVAARTAASILRGVIGTPVAADVLAVAQFILAGPDLARRGERVAEAAPICDCWSRS